MPLFKKKPSIQEQRSALGLIPGTPVSLEQYTPMLRDALNVAAAYREPPEIGEAMGLGGMIQPDQGPALLSMVMQEFAPLHQAVRRIQEIHPDIPQLLGVHVAAADYLEQFMLTADRYNISLRLDLQGEEQRASKMYEEAQRRNAEVIKARNRLAAELRQLNRKDRTLFSSLAIPYETLARLSLVAN